MTAHTPTITPAGGTMSYEKEIAAARAYIADQGNSLERDRRRIRCPHAVAEPLQDRPRHRQIHRRHHARDMAAYDADPTNYTQSLGCWHGFIGQQKMISIKKHFGTTKGRYLYLSGWMVAALRSEFGPLPDQSMHEKTSVPALIEELYTFLRQADARELGGLFRDLDAAREAGDAAKIAEVSDRDRQLPDPCRADHRRHRCRFRQCGSDLSAGQEDDRSRRLRPADRKPGVGRKAVRPPGRQGHGAARGFPPEDPRLPLRLPGTGRRKRHHRHPHRLARRRPDQADRRIRTSRAISATSTTPSSTAKKSTADELQNGDVVINRDGKLLRPKRLPSNLFQFRAGTGEDRCVLDCITSLQNGADLLWIETEKPHVEPDRRHGEPHPRSHSERQAGLQQLAIVQLDAELPPAGLRRNGRPTARTSPPMTRRD